MTKLAKFYEGFLTVGGLLTLATLTLVFHPGCSSTDPLTLKNIEHAEQIFEDTHRDIVADELWLELPADEQAATIPESEYKAAKAFFDAAQGYERSKGDE